MSCLILNLVVAADQLQNNYHDGEFVICEGMQTDEHRRSGEWRGDLEGVNLPMIYFTEFLTFNKAINFYFVPLCHLLPLAS